jgi:hypothetical protein
MRRKRHLQMFLGAWSLVSLASAAMNTQAIYYGTMLPRTFCLGVLLMIAGGLATLQRPGSIGRPVHPAHSVSAYIYMALFATLGMPTVFVRLVANNEAAQDGLRRGASVSFILGVLALLLVRTLGRLMSREPPCEADASLRWGCATGLQSAADALPVATKRRAR